MNDDFTNLIEKGRPYLREYLEEQGIEIGQNGKFSCIDKDHEDSNPSANLVPDSDEMAFYCHGCGVHGDIYSAANMLEDKPTLGLAFVTENLQYVLDRYSIPYDPIELSEEQSQKMRYQKVYETAAKLLIAVQPDGEFRNINVDFAKERGWTRETCISLGIGTVINYNKFLDVVSRSTGIAKSILGEEMDLTKKLFGPKRLTFTIRNHKGEVCGFVSRTIGWKPEHSTQKYYNTSAYNCPLYDKKRLLYGLYNTAKRRSLRLDVFEGYGSYVTAFQAGYTSCCAIGGTAFTEEHVDLLYSLGFRKINLVFDVDQSGQNVSAANMDRFGGYQGLSVSVMRLPITEEEMSIKGQNDPDYFISTHGLDKYRQVPVIGAFEHMLAREDVIPGSEEAVELAKHIIKIIINEPSVIDRGRMLDTLARVTGVAKDDLQDELNRIESNKVGQIKDNLSKRLRNVRNPDDLASVLHTASTALQETSSTKADRHLSSVAESVEAWTDIFAEMGKMRKGVHGWTTGFQPIDEMIDGIEKPSSGGGKAYGFGGAPQHGKSAVMLQIALNIARLNKDVAVLYWAIDDNRKAIAFRLVSIISGVSIKKIRRMNGHTPNKEEELLIRAAQQEIIQLCEEGRLVYKDDKFGRSKNKALFWIKEMQDVYGRDILFAIDSLHNVRGSGEGEQRSKLISSSLWAKSLCTSVPLSVMATMELVKNRTDQKPNLQSISESGKMEFDFDAVAIVWNEVQGKYGDMDATVAKWQGPNGYPCPIIELDWQKNKSGAGEKGPVYFQFDPLTTQLKNPTRRLEGTELATPTQAVIGGKSVSVSNSMDRTGRLVRSPSSGFTLS